MSRAALKGTNLRAHTPICNFLQVPAVFCGFLAVRKSAVFCKNLLFPNASFSGKWREPAKTSENPRDTDRATLEDALSANKGPTQVPGCHSTSPGLLHSSILKNLYGIIVKPETRPQVAENTVVNTVVSLGEIQSNCQHLSVLMALKKPIKLHGFNFHISSTSIRCLAVGKKVLLPSAKVCVYEGKTRCGRQFPWSQ